MAVALAAIGSAGFARPTAAELTSDDTFLAIDGTVFERQEGASLSMCEATKHPDNPVLTTGEPGTADALRVSFPWVLLEDGLYRMWYIAYDGERFTTCYAESDDGVSWRRPVLGIANYRGSTQNNVIDPSNLGTSPWVYRDDADPDPARRYKTTVVGTINASHFDTDEQRKKYAGSHPSLEAIAYSPDGLRWTRETANPFPIKAKLECPVLYRFGGKWHIGHQMNSGDYPTVDRWSRFVGYSTSSDLIHWKLGDKPAFAFDPKFSGIIQTHASPGFQNYGNVMVGAEGLFQNNAELLDQEADLTLILTNDGTSWRQPKPSQPLTYLLRRGNRGAWDQSFLVHGNLLNAGDTTRFYYSAGDYGNASVISLQIGMASLRLDGYGYLAPQVGWAYSKPEYEAKVLSKPILLKEQGLRLYLNHRSLGREGDAVTAALFDASGQPIDGYGHSDCDPLPAEGVGTPIAWGGSGDLSALTGRRLRVEIRMVGDNPRRWAVARAEMPQLYAFYFDSPGLWRGAKTPVVPGRGLTRLDFRDPVRPKLTGLEVVSDQPVTATLVELDGLDTTVRLEGAGAVRLMSDRLAAVRVLGREVAVNSGVAALEVDGSTEVRVRLAGE